MNQERSKAARQVAVALGVGLILGVSTPTLAQDWIGPTPMDYANMTMNTTNTAIMNYQIERMTGADKLKKSRSKTTTSRSNRIVSPATYTYTATDAQKASVLNGYIQAVAKTNADLAAKLREQFTKYRYDAIFNGLLSGTGLATNNLADVLAAYTVQSWMIVHNKQTDLSSAQIAGVRQQWANALATTKLANDASARTRNAEELKIRTVLLNAGWKDAMKVGGLPAYGSLVDKAFRSLFKLDLTGLTITSAGLVKK
ncbi:hypothetical protein FAES_0245 [Fibrella aestuarina BUZ 2]|uniref:Uncharacterized protein n=1 Tax=Fibrella aestuarina BUZ 2 TaxID=1166018 RepID=I0K2A6_9BACT|nr:hypothetical protein [Fibrella aestuarina]CCG98259.1 hypothetical protein FAES_0245 [Fibrella aestuarina BUZ 2]